MGLDGVNEAAELKPLAKEESLQDDLGIDAFDQVDTKGTETKTTEVQAIQDMGEVHSDPESPGETTALVPPKLEHSLDNIPDPELASSSLIVRPHLSSTTYALARIQMMLQAHVYIILVQTYLLHLYAFILHLLSGGRVPTSHRRK